MAPNKPKPSGSTEQGTGRVVSIRNTESTRAGESTKYQHISGIITLYKAVCLFKHLEVFLIKGEKY